MFKKGDLVKMTQEALENYGEEYAGMAFEVESVATKYMSSKQFYAQNMPNGYHPGYDEAADGKPLYDLVGLEFSLYYWEVESWEN